MEYNLTLLSPVGAESINFRLSEDGKNESKEIFDVIKCVCKVVPNNVRNSIVEFLLYGSDLKNLENLIGICDQYNRCLGSYLENQKGKTFPNLIPDSEIMKHIIQLAYQRSVIQPDKLNHYQPFSPEVYGETSFEFIDEMLKSLMIGEDEIFIDMGSGIGQVIMQVAASKKFQMCYGIEKAETPYQYSLNMETEFKKLMNFYGLTYSPFKIFKGDFLMDKFTNILNESTTIFVNNFAFGPILNHKLKMKFANLKEGSKIISSREFCSLNFRITDRNLSDFGAIVKMKQFSPMRDAVSWTDKPISYYLHQIDRTILEKYFNRKKRRQLFKSPFTSSVRKFHNPIAVCKKKRAKFVEPLSTNVQTTNKTDDPMIADLSKVDLCPIKSNLLLHMEMDLEKILETHRIAYTQFLNRIQDEKFKIELQSNLKAEEEIKSSLMLKRDALFKEIDLLESYIHKNKNIILTQIHKLKTRNNFLDQKAQNIKRDIFIEEKKQDIFWNCDLAKLYNRKNTPCITIPTNTPPVAVNSNLPNLSTVSYKHDTITRLKEFNIVEMTNENGNIKNMGGDSPSIDNFSDVINVDNQNSNNSILINEMHILTPPQHLSKLNIPVSFYQFSKIR